MGNHASSGERRGKGHDHSHIVTRTEGPFNIDKHGSQKLVSQHSDDDSVHVFCKPESEANKENDEPFPSASRPIINPENKKMLPCVIKWSGGGKDVCLAGTFNDWKTLPMVKSEKDFIAIVDLPEGMHEYKFLVDGEWKVNTADKACSNALGTENNVLKVKEADFEELENALLKDPNDKKESPFGVTPLGFLKADVPTDKDEYGQEIPETSRPSDKKKGPPVLPPHLLQVILNKDTPVSCEPTLLPEPDHVMLNHMYALSIRDGMMVLSTSHRFRKKCVTTLIYRPI